MPHADRQPPMSHKSKLPTTQISCAAHAHVTGSHKPKHGMLRAWHQTGSLDAPVPVAAVEVSWGALGFPCAAST
jgi:hypothetical protein